MNRAGGGHSGQVGGASPPAQAGARPPLVVKGDSGVRAPVLGGEPQAGRGRRRVGNGPIRNSGPERGRVGSGGAKRGRVRTRRRTWRRGAGLIVLLPATLLLAFAFYVPMGTVLLQALRVAPGAGQGSLPAAADGTGLVDALKTAIDTVMMEYSLTRFVELITDPYIVRLIGFTAWQALLSTLLSIAIGLPLAYVLANRSFRGKALLSSMIMVPFVMPAVTVALGFLLMFGVNGWFNETLHFLFGTKVRVLHSLWAIVLAHAFFNAPLVARMTQGAWERLDPALEESARTLGAGRAAVWRDVTLPAILPGVVSGGLLAFVYCFMSFPVVLALGGARFSTLEVEIYTMIRVLLDYEMGAALAAVQAAISLLFAYVMLRIEGITPHSFASSRARRAEPLFAWPRRDRWQGAGRARRRVARRNAGRDRRGDRWQGAGQDGRAAWRKILRRDVWLWVFLAGVALLFVGPIASIVVDSMRDVQGNVTLLAYKRVLGAGHDVHLGGPPVRSIQNSVRFGLIAASIALAAGATFVYGVVRIVRRPIPLVETLTLAPVAVSSVALAYGILLAFRQPPLNMLSDELRIPLIHAVLAFPFVIRAFRPVLQGVDAGLVEAARTLGAGRWRAFVDIELPLALTGLLVAFALSFGLSVSETTAALMLSRPDQVTMPVTVYRFLASRDFAGAAAMAVLLMAVTGGVFLLSEALAGTVRRRGGGTERGGAMLHGAGSDAVTTTRPQPSTAQIGVEVDRRGVFHGN